MRPFVFAILLCAGLSAFAGEADGEQLLRDLQGDDFDLRRAATVRLEAMGEEARAILEKAARSGHPEMQATAAALLKKLESSVLSLAVYDRDGKPMGGVEADVKLYFQQRNQSTQYSEPRNESIQLQPNGRAELANLTPGPINVQFEWKKAARDGSSWQNLDLQRGVNPLVLTLVRGGELKAKVQNAAGEPLRDASLTLYNNKALESDLLDLQLSLVEQWDRSGINATTDKDGLAHFESVNEGTYQIVVRADGHVTALGPTVTLRSGRLLELPALKLQPKKSGKLQFALMKRNEDRGGDREKDPKEKEKDPKKSEPADGLLKKQRVVYELEYIFEGPNAAELQKKQRQFRQAMTNFRNNESPETDEQGRLTLEDLRPGRYRLNIMSGNEAPWRVEELVIKAGETTDLGVLQNIATGSVKGKILDAEGKGVQYMNVTLSPETQDDENDGQVRVIHFGGRVNPGGARSVQSQKDGTYEIKNLPPGRYVATTYTRKSQPVRIEGIVVEAGRTAEAAEVRLPGDAGAAASGRGFSVKGIVKLPDGKPAAQSTINLHSTTFGRWTRNTDDKGQFDFSFSPEQGWTPTAISVKAPNCKAAKVDLTAPGIKLDSVEIQLEKQDYGAVRIKVTDEKGVPLEGVSFRPRQTRTRYNAFNQIIDRRAVTNKAGEARLSGLATGPRTFQVDLEGYFLGEPLTANVLADTETEVSVRLKRGVTVRGRIEVGDAMGSTIAMLAGTATRTAALNANGGFEFSGVTPGDYWISAAGPGLTTLERVKLTVTPNGTIPEIVVKAVRAGGAVLDLPDNRSSGSLTLVRRDKNRIDDPLSMKHYGNGYLDMDGRAEFWGAAPGEYELLVHPSSPMSVIAPYRSNNVRAVKSAAASIFAGPVTVRPMKSYDDLRKMDAVKLDLPPTTASVRGTISVEPALKGSQQNTGSLTLRLVGERANATVTFNYPAELASAVQRDPIVFGGKGDDETKKKPAVPPPGAFKFTGLPAGEYKLFVDVTPYRYSATGISIDSREKKVPVPQQMVTVKENEALDLGALTFTVSPEIIESMRQIHEANMDTEPEDQIPLFQP